MLELQVLKQEEFGVAPLGPQATATATMKLNRMWRLYRNRSSNGYRPISGQKGFHNDLVSLS